MTVFENVAVAVRQIQKNKVFASIIVFALSIGTAACLLIFQYASYELSFDRHNPYFRNAYRVNMRMFENNIFRYETARTPKYVLREIRERIPGIDASVRVNSTGWSGSPILDSNRSPIVFGTGSPDPSISIKNLI